MKKIISTAVACALTAMITVNACAAPIVLAYDGTVQNYTGQTYNLKVNGEIVPTEMPTIIFDDRAMVPARAVFEKLGATVNWDGASQKVLVGLNNTNVELKINDKNALVNNKTVELDVPAKIINNRTMVPARFVAEQLNMKVDWLPDESLITIDQSRLKNVGYINNGREEVITISLDYFKSYNIFKLSDPDRLVIDFPNARSTDELQRLDINGSLVKSIRYREFESNVTRVVMDLNAQFKYRTEENEGQLIIYLSSQADRGGDVRPTDPEPVPTPQPSPVPTPAPTPEPTPVPTPEPQLPLIPLSQDGNISHAQSGEKDEVIIPLKNYEGYKVIRASDPDRLIVDIPYAFAPKKEQRIKTDSSRIKTIRYAQFTEETARVVLDLTGQLDYQIEERQGQLVVAVKNPTYGNVTYHNNADRVYFSLKWTKLTDSEDEIKRLYTGKYDATGKSYTITFPGYAKEFMMGTMKINDSFMDNAVIAGNEKTGQTSITFNAKEKLFYEIITRYDISGNVIDTAVTLLRPASNGEKLVVIDPGHGGYETGAAPSGDFLEKNLNLDIAKRLNKLLESKGIKTYMIREDDSYVGLYERAYIANDLNASLFISIHNNALNSTVKGTETLYFTSDINAPNFNSIKFAQIIQAQLINALKTNDRRIVERPRLVVLRKTTMPAALTEIGFMDNKEEAENLKKDEYKQKAAVALCDAIIKSLTEIK